MGHFKEYKKLDLLGVSKEILNFWKKEKTFEKTVSNREGAESFVFYEGPPSANGLPGVHHVLSRTIKDIFCRFQTLNGKQVNRKAGWDTHGLPVELSVEKELGITKVDIGKKISIEEYNQKCRENVMKYKEVWNDLTERIGYWVDMDDPYITYDSKYIESVWYLLKQLHDKKLLYKGYTIQPYSPAAGTGLSTHELNQPGTYRMVKDTTVVAQFKVIDNEHSAKLWDGEHGELFALAWTTTPWTLPSNAALVVGKNIGYAVVKTFNKYTHEPITVILGEELVPKYFNEKAKELSLNEYDPQGKLIPFEVVKTVKGEELVGLQYEQLFDYVQPLNNGEKAFHIIDGDFVTTDEGTGIVHAAPTFGADDARVAKEHGVPPITVMDENGAESPLVNLQGKFVSQMGEFAGEFVKEEYLKEEDKAENYLSVDVRLAIQLKERNRAFEVAKYEHSYPHCWRTDKPVLYYPLDSWFVKTTEVKDRLIELNQEINWKPASTGTGRFGNWLENLQDWNLSRSRYWGIPLPIWANEDKTELKCIGSLEELKQACQVSVDAGFMKTNPLEKFEAGNFEASNYSNVDLHRPWVDNVVLASSNGEAMHRETDLIDVWFDSGSMPYAQWHYPFENKEIFEKCFPADFIAEGVDQTRGWFFTLHAIATTCFDKIAYKNVVSNGLVLDKNGHKMSKRLGNAVDPFQVLDTYGPDALRWYMISNAQPWENLKFDIDGIKEVQNKFFGTLYNTYSFFALYANVDGFKSEEELSFEERPELDRWILSKLNSLIKEVHDHYSTYEPTRAARAIQSFVINHLSNWYVRLSRRRFWKGDYSTDKISAYQTLYQCLKDVSIISAPLAPFYMDQLYRDLAIDGVESVHLENFPEVNEVLISRELEQKMEMAQDITSLVLSVRKKERLKVRQPLQKILVPVKDQKQEAMLDAVSKLVLSEVNVKELLAVEENNDIVVRQAKPNFKALGPRYGKLMKAIGQEVANLTGNDINAFLVHGKLEIPVQGENVVLEEGDLEIVSKDIPGWSVASNGNISVALDIALSDDLVHEGIAREFVNRIQNLRKERGLNVTDKILLQIKGHDKINTAINNNKQYICDETLAERLDIVDVLNIPHPIEIEIDTELKTSFGIDKITA